MRFFLLALFLSTFLFGNIATVVDSIGYSTLFRAGESYDVTPKQELQEHDKIVTGKDATIGIRGTVFAAYVTAQKDDVFCTDGKITLFTPQGDVGVSAGRRADVRAGARPHIVIYTQAQKEQMLKKSGWKSGKSLKELIVYIKNNFKEPLRSQLLATIRNILKKDSDSRRVFLPPVKKQWKNADGIGFIDELTLNGREFDSLNEREIEFYPEDLEDGNIVVKGILESEDKKIPLSSLYVEVSTDGGSSWKKAKGHEEWEFSFIPEMEKTYEFGLRVVQEKQLSQHLPKELLVLKELDKDINPVYLNDFDKGAKPSDKSITSSPAKVITTKSIIVQFKSLAQKAITTKPIVVKFKSLEQKFITTDPIIVKFKSFAQKAITTDPIIVKFSSHSYEATTPTIVFKLKQPSVYETTTPTIKFKLKQPTVYEATTPTIKFKLKNTTVYETTTPTIKFKLKQPTVYETTTPTIKFKLR